MLSTLKEHYVDLLFFLIQEKNDGKAVISKGGLDKGQIGVKINAKDTKVIGYAVSIFGKQK